MILASLSDLEIERWLRNRENFVWKTKNGDLIPITQMTDEHLDNTIRMIERNMELESHIGDGPDF